MLGPVLPSNPRQQIRRRWRMSTTGKRILRESAQRLYRLLGLYMPILWHVRHAIGTKFPAGGTIQATDAGLRSWFGTYAIAGYGRGYLL